MSTWKIELSEQQLELFADRTSTQTFAPYQLRLWLSSMAYVLMQAFRQHCLAKTSKRQGYSRNHSPFCVEIGSQNYLQRQKNSHSARQCLSLSRYFGDCLPTHPITSCDWIIFPVGSRELTFLLN